MVLTQGITIFSSSFITKIYILFIVSLPLQETAVACSSSSSIAQKGTTSSAVRCLPHHNKNNITTTMKLAFAIAAVAALQKAAIVRADCGFGSDYYSSWTNSYSCPFDVGLGYILLSSESTTKLGDGGAIVTTTTESRNLAIWKMGDKESTVQCYDDITFNEVSTAYVDASGNPNGSKFYEFSGDVYLAMGSENVTLADVFPLSNPGLYYFEGGNVEFMRDELETGGHSWTYYKAEGDDMTDLCEVLGGGGGGAAPSPANSMSYSSSMSISTLTKAGKGKATKKAKTTKV